MTRVPSDEVRSFDDKYQTSDIEYRISNINTSISRDSPAPWIDSQGIILLYSFTPLLLYSFTSLLLYSSASFPIQKSKIKMAHQHHNLTYRPAEEQPVPSRADQVSNVRILYTLTLECSCQSSPILLHASSLTKFAATQRCTRPFDSIHTFSR